MFTIRIIFTMVCDGMLALIVDVFHLVDTVLNASPAACCTAEAGVQTYICISTCSPRALQTQSLPGSVLD
jgi:hypothetical protein